jgi:hypothetical protein
MDVSIGFICPFKIPEYQGICLVAANDYGGVDDFVKLESLVISGINRNPLQPSNGQSLVSHPNNQMLPSQHIMDTKKLQSSPSPQYASINTPSPQPFSKASPSAQMPASKKNKSSDSVANTPSLVNSDSPFASAASPPFHNSGKMQYGSPSLLAQGNSPANQSLSPPNNMVPSPASKNASPPMLVNANMPKPNMITQAQISQPQSQQFIAQPANQQQFTQQQHLQQRMLQNSMASQILQNQQINSYSGGGNGMMNNSLSFVPSGQADAMSQADKLKQLTNEKLLSQQNSQMLLQQQQQLQNQGMNMTNAAPMFHNPATMSQQMLLQNQQQMQFLKQQQFLESQRVQIQQGRGINTFVGNAIGQQGMGQQGMGQQGMGQQGMGQQGMGQQGMGQQGMGQQATNQTTMAIWNGSLTWTIGQGSNRCEMSCGVSACPLRGNVTAQDWYVYSKIFIIVISNCGHRN